MLSVSLLILFAILLVSVLSFADAAGDQSHPFTVHDLLAMDRISDPQASPDGERVVFVVRVTDLDANKGRNDLWLVNCDGGGPRRLTNHPAGSSQPRWAPDGNTIYFLSSRTDSPQVWRIAPDGGEAEQVTDLPLDVDAFAVSPNGEHLAVSMEVFPEAGSIEDTKQRLDANEERKPSGRTFDRLFIRHWDAWKDGRRAHLFIVPTAGGEPIDIMQGMDADVPSKPFGGAEEFTFTPDGRSVVFAAKAGGADEAWTTRFDLHAAPIDGSSESRVIVDNRGAVATNPVFSPDGRTLAYLAMARAGYEADRFRIALLPWPEGGETPSSTVGSAGFLPADTTEPRVLTESWDHSASRIVWSRDGVTIYTCAHDVGQTPLFAIDVASGEVRKLIADGKVTEIVVANERLVYGLCHHRSPVELYGLRNPDECGTGVSPVTETLTGINTDKLAATRMGASEQFSFKGWNDETVHAYIVKPADFDARKQYPVAFLVHGGPQGSFSNDFHYRWNPQVYAGAGYGVVMVDFHGSTGYGQAFSDAINDHWGDRPLEDLQKGLAAALERYPWLDRDRIGALGASYGGYMLNWMHGVWSEPFKCFVCHDGNLDERMAYYDTEELWFPEWERKGPPWESPEAYTKHNPIDHVDKWSTPTLIIHGANDYRVVDTQGLATFTALQRRGVPSRLLYFPDENHWVLKPHNSIQWHEEVLAWLGRWLRDE